MRHGISGLLTSQMTSPDVPVIVETSLLYLRSRTQACLHRSDTVPPGRIETAGTRFRRTGHTIDPCTSAVDCALTIIDSRRLWLQRWTAVHATSYATAPAGRTDLLSAVRPRATKPGAAMSTGQCRPQPA